MEQHWTLAWRAQSLMKGRSAHHRRKVDDWLPLSAFHLVVWEMRNGMGWDRVQVPTLTILCVSPHYMLVNDCLGLRRAGSVAKKREADTKLSALCCKHIWGTIPVAVRATRCVRFVGQNRDNTVGSRDPMRREGSPGRLCQRPQERQCYSSRGWVLNAW